MGLEDVTLDSGAIHHRLVTPIRPHLSAFIYLSVFFYHQDFHFLCLPIAVLCLIGSFCFFLYLYILFLLVVFHRPKLIGFFDQAQESLHYGRSPRIVVTVILSFYPKHYSFVPAMGIRRAYRIFSLNTNNLPDRRHRHSASLIL